MKIKLLVFLLIFFSNIIIAETVEKNENKLFVLNRKSLNKIATLSTIERDSFFKTHLNNLIYAKGYIEAVKEKSRFKRKYRITLIDSSAVKKIDIRYYVYTDNEEYLDLLSKGDLFEFKGQFIMYTPLNSNRNLYVFDVILEDGAILVE